MLFSFSLAFPYYTFWTTTTYILKFSKRKFQKTSLPTANSMAHDIWYWTLGMMNWGLFETVFIFLCQWNQVKYQETPLISGIGGGLDLKSSTGTSFGVKELQLFFMWQIFVPYWRNIHFYLCHRMIHHRQLFKYIHSVHHRNTDVEPFSGLCMHPIEHLYLFSQIGPNVLMISLCGQIKYANAGTDTDVQNSGNFSMNTVCAMFLSFIASNAPFHFFWNGVHSLLSAQCTHSGFEDIMQSSQFHYQHHTRFEGNYGSQSGFPMDDSFGTFRDGVQVPKRTQQIAKKVVDESENSENSKNKSTSSATNSAKVNEASVQVIEMVSYNEGLFNRKTLFFHSNMGDMMFTLGYVSLYSYLVYDFLNNTNGDQSSSYSRSIQSILAGFLASFGPVVIAVVLYKLQSKKSDRSLVWPFDKEPAKKFYTALILSILVSVLPIYQMAKGMFDVGSVMIQPIKV